MKHSKIIFLCLIGVVITFVAFLPACNIKQPVGPGGVADFTSSNCNGVLGNNTISSIPVAGDTTLWLNPFVSSANTTLTQLSIYLASSSPITYEMGVYSNSVTSPSTLLASTAPQTTAPVTVWSTGSLGHNLPLSAGVTYWLAIHSSISNYGNGGVRWASQTLPANTYGSLPSSFTGTVNSTLDTFSIYGTTCP